jgi:hypothetical protein
VPDQPTENTGPPADAAPSPPRSALDLLQSIGGAAGVLIGVAFIGGWLYWATYYSAFGLNPLVLDFSTSDVSVSPLWVIWRDLRSEQGAAPVVLLVALLLCAALGALFVHLYADRRPYAILPLLTLIVLMSSGALALGMYDAKLDSGCQSRLPDVAFQLNVDPDPDDPPVPCLIPNYCKLILHASGAYHYFEPPAVCSDFPPGGGFATQEFFETALKAVHINRPVGW